MLVATTSPATRHGEKSRTRGVSPLCPFYFEQSMYSSCIVRMSRRHESLKENCEYPLPLYRRYVTEMASLAPRETFCVKK